MRVVNPDGVVEYIDEPVGAIVDDYLEAGLDQGWSFLKAVQNAIGRAHMMVIEDDFLVGPRRTLKR